MNTRMEKQQVKSDSVCASVGGPEHDENKVVDRCSIEKSAKWQGGWGSKHATSAPQMRSLEMSFLTCRQSPTGDKDGSL